MLPFDDPQLHGAFAWATAEQAPRAEGSLYCESRDIFNARLEQLRRQHQEAGLGDAADLLNAVIAEIGGNSFDHNLGQWKDVPGVYLADIRWDQEDAVVVADRGQGVRTTIQRAVAGTLTNDLDALHLAFLRRITGRVGERRGNGLKFVREIVRERGMGLYFQSGTGAYRIGSGGEEWITTKEVVPGCLAVVSFPIR